MTSPEDTVRIGPRRSRHLRRAGAFVVAGVLLLAPLAAGGAHDRDGAATHPLAVLAGMLMLLWAAAVLLSLALGLPRLRLDRNGVAVHGAWGTRAAGWKQIGAFATVSEGTRRDVPGRAVAPWLQARRRLRARGGFAIPDVFDMPLPQLLELVALRRPGAPGGTAFAPRPPERPCGVPGFRWPWLTATMLAAMVLVFAAEWQASTSLGSPSGADGRLSHATLLAMGGVSRVLVASGQWYRLLSASLLHASVAHLFGNAVAFALAGYALERFVGRAWLFCIFALGAAGGSLASIAQAPALLSVGASGAIMAMLVALPFVSLRLPPGRARTTIRLRSAWTAIPALIPFGTQASAPHVDYAAHFGGALVGLVLGPLLLRNWRSDQPLPGPRRGTTVLAGVAALGFAASMAAVAVHYSGYARSAAGLIPEARIPHTDQQVEARAEGLRAQYPLDPRSHLYAGGERLRRGDMAGAETELRLALSLAADHADILLPVVPAVIRAYLALAVFGQHRIVEAADIAAPVCGVGKGNVLPAVVLALLTQRALCPDTARSP